MKSFLARNYQAAACGLLLLSALTPAPVRASIAYGSINNFDTVNDTGHECHGFEIEIEDCRSTDITYTYNYNHYGVPLITQDDSVPAHPKCTIRWQSKKNTDGTWAAYTAIPSGPISPTNGHMFTNPSVNFGGEHFGVGYSLSVGAVRYNWLIDNGTGTLVHGGAVQVSTPVFNYSPPVPGVAAAVQAVIKPPVPPAPEPKEFGKAVWMKEIRTTTHNNQEIKLRELVSDDPDRANDKNWANGEPDEVEVEWQIMQRDYGKADGGANNEIQAAPEDLPNNDEVVTRRYEFYKYTGPLDTESGEAMGDAVAADGLHGVGVKIINGVSVDLSTVAVVGDYVGAQMAAMDVDAPVGLIDHVGEARINTPFAPRTVVVEGANPFTATREGALPPGMSFNEVTGVISGTPTASGSYQFKVTAGDGVHPEVAKNYVLVVAAVGANPPPASLLDTTSSPVNGGTTTGDGAYAVGAEATITAVPAPGFVFVEWTDNGQVVSSNSSHTVTMDVNHSLAASFLPAYEVTTAANPQAGGSTTGDGTFPEGQGVTVIAVPAAGYAFTAWTEDGAVVSSNATFTFAVASHRNLVAQFTQGVSHVITTTAAPAAGGNATGGGSYAAGASITVTAQASAGYAFVNWTRSGTQVSTTPAYTFIASASESLVANFVVATGTQRTISTTSSPLAGGTTTGGGVYADGSSITVSATANPGYIFSKWKEGGSNISSSPSHTFTVTADRALTAVFVQAYIVGTTSAPAAGGSTEVDSSSYKLDENAKAFAYPAAGYQFVNWQENGTVVSTENPYSFRVTGDRFLTAQFSLAGGVVVTAGAAPAAGGVVSGSGSYLTGSSVTLTATPAAGYGFLRWTESGTPVSTDSSYVFTASSARTLMAQFAAGHTVTASASPVTGGTVSGGGFVPEGSSITLTAAANPGHEFVHWTNQAGEEVSLSPAHTFSPTADDIFTAWFQAAAAGIRFDFDTGTPALGPDSVFPLSQSSVGWTAAFDSTAADAFDVTSESATGRTLAKFQGNYLESLLDGAFLVIQLDQPVTGVSLDFATVEPVNVAVPSNLQLTAYDTSSGSPESVGVGIAHGTVTAGDTLPTGTLAFNSASGSFDQIVLRLPDAPAGAARFMIDNMVVSPAASTGGTMLLANPSWNITLTDFGYSDFLLDNTPGFEGREYLSGEWGGAVAYSRDGKTAAPTWLEPNFLFPDWRTNSDFHVVTGIHLVGSNVDGLPIAESVIANDDLEITLRFEMIDTVTGTPMGVSPASSAAPPKFVPSNRYVLSQTSTVRNISGSTVTGLQLFQLLHGFISQRGQYDNRSHAGKLPEYRYDMTMSGTDAASAGGQSSSEGLEDLIGFHSKRVPSAFEIGHYGIEANGVDDHSLGKPSEGVHLSIENNWQSAPYLARKNQDSFAPASRWVAGAQRWDLGSLAPGQSTSMDILLSLLTGTKVVVSGGGGGGGGSCNGGSSHAGGVDFEFEDVEQEGTFFGEFSGADDDELLERENDGEFALPTFDTPAGTRRQRWNLSYGGTHTGKIRLRFAYDPALLPAGYDENQLSIYHFHNGVWEKLHGKVNPAANTIETETTSLSPFMLGINDLVVRPDVSLSTTAPGSVDVSWDASFTGWVLQESPDLALWTTSTRATTTQGGRISASVPLDTGMRYFRLLRP